MNVVDSSGWLEYFSDGPNAQFFAPAIEDVGNLIVPTICVYEVFKWVLLRQSEGKAFEAVAIMHQGKIVDLDASIALNAAKISTQFRLPMADSAILATARASHATVWTQDSDFDGLPNVRFIAKT